MPYERRTDVRDPWSEPVETPPPPAIRQLAPRPGGPVIATEKIFEHGALVYLPADLVPFERAVALGLADPEPAPPEPVTPVERFTAPIAAAQRAARRRTVRR